MDLQNILLPVLSFFVGWLSSSGIYMWRFSNRITKIETMLDMMIKKVDRMPADPPPCQFHIDLDKRVVELKGRVDAINPQ